MATTRANKLPDLLHPSATPASTNDTFFAIPKKGKFKIIEHIEIADNIKFHNQGFQNFYNNDARASFEPIMCCSKSGYLPLIVEQSDDVFFEVTWCLENGYFA